MSVEGVVDRCMGGEAFLGGRLRFEALDFSLSSPDRQVRVFGSIVVAQSTGVVQAGDASGS